MAVGRRSAWPRRASLLGVALALAATTAHPARAETTEVVTLEDGTSLRGVLLELVDGDHVTLRLPSGETRRVEWGDITFSAQLPGVFGAAAITSPPWSPPRVPREPPLSATPPHALPAPDAETGAGAVYAASAEAEPRGKPPIMSSRIALGVDSGYRAPLGRVGFDAAWYPIRWVGFDFGYGLPVDGPSTTAENLFVSWPLVGPLEMGIGAGFTQSFVAGSNGGHSGVVNDLDLEAVHLNLFATRDFSVRTAVGYAFNLSGGDYCDAHASLCPAIRTLYATAGLAWNFDLGGGRR